MKTLFVTSLIALLLVPAASAQRTRLDKPDLYGDRIRLERISTELVQLEKEMHGLQKAFKVVERGFYTAAEHDQIESLLFRYLLCRSALWDIVHRYRYTYDELTTPKDRTRALILGFSSALHLAYYSSTLVNTFSQEKFVVAKLNEAFHRTQIPEGTWDRIFTSITKVEHLQELRGAWTIYEKELKDPDSPLNKLVKADKDYRTLNSQIVRFFGAADDNVERILKDNSLLFPDLRNQLRHSVVSDILRKTQLNVDDRLYAARAVLFHRVSRIHDPTSKLISFTPRQVDDLHDLLQPGDVILTFTEGYMSNVFLPGVFKHGITYIGSPEKRQAAGITAALAGSLPPHRRAAFRKSLTVEKTVDGHEADVIEAVAEGVVFSSLDHILETHINRLAVLRPRIAPSHRAQALTTVFSLLENGYDFKFDFGDGSYQCCTEVIYRSLHERGDIELALTSRMGKPTLSADDILNQHFAADKPMFDFIVMAEGRPEAKTKAVLLSEGKGHDRLKSLMTAE
jgi:hypothetical protein